MKTTLVWLRLDLRVLDHPSLKEAAESGAVVPVFVWSPEEEAPWQPGAASRWWLRRSLEALDADLRRRGSGLILRRGPAAQALARLARETGADAVYFSRRVEPACRRQEQDVSTTLNSAGLQVRAFPGNYLFDPDVVRGREGRPYRVFTPYWSRCGELPGPAKPCGEPGPLRRPVAWPASEPLEGLDPGDILPEAPEPGEKAARRALAAFRRKARDYAASRDYPGVDGTSLLSARLRFGELDVRRVWAETAAVSAAPFKKGGFLGELGWRDFGAHVLFHRPETPEAPHNPRFRGFRWRRDAVALKAWQEGRTGFPIVDAGMRQLRRTGLMHNRVRMIAASFLVKDLLIDWREGARWFWDALVDADLASNTLNWQWSAGCGTDAAPFFRVFNPAEQARRFDPEGAYVRRWLPELGTKGYPAPIVDHGEARARALAAYGAAA